MPVYNNGYKTVGFQWVIQLRSPLQVWCGLIGYFFAIPTAFIPAAVTGNTKKEEPVCIYFAFVYLRHVLKSTFLLRNRLNYVPFYLVFVRLYI